MSSIQSNRPEKNAKNNNNKKKNNKKTFSGDDAKLKGTRKVDGAGKKEKEGRGLGLGLTARPLPSFPTFYFRVRAFLLQRTRLSRSLEQAIYCFDNLPDKIAVTKTRLDCNSSANIHFPNYKF